MSAYFKWMFAAIAALGVTTAGVAFYRHLRWVPKGKGVFFRGISSWGSPSEMADRIRREKIGWVIFIGEDWSPQVTSYSPSKIGQYAKAARDAGADVWLWGFPAPENQSQWPAHFKALAKETKAKGVVLNVEKPYYGHDHASQISQLISNMQKAGMRVLVSSYGSVKSHPNFPWAAIRGADGGMPMIYDLKNKLGTSYPPRSVAQWREMFEVVIPVWGMAASSGQTLEEEKALANATPLPQRAVAAWDAYWLSRKSGGRGAWYGALDVSKWPRS